VKIFPGDRHGGAVYAPLTVYIKTHERTPAQPVDRITLRDTGAFYKGIRVSHVTRDKFTLDSTDRKTQELEDRYGERIFGLDADSRRQYIDQDFFPELKAYIEATAKLKMK